MIGGLGEGVFCDWVREIVEVLVVSDRLTLVIIMGGLASKIISIKIKGLNKNGLF